jgi:hypothetical protein
MWVALHDAKSTGDEELEMDIAVVAVVLATSAPPECLR